MIITVFVRLSIVLAAPSKKYWSKPIRCFFLSSSNICIQERKLRVAICADTYEMYNYITVPQNKSDFANHRTCQGEIPQAHFPCSPAQSEASSIEGTPRMPARRKARSGLWVNSKRQKEISHWHLSHAHTIIPPTRIPHQTANSSSSSSTIDFQTEEQKKTFAAGGYAVNG